MSEGWDSDEERAANALVRWADVMDATYATDFLEQRAVQPGSRLSDDDERTLPYHFSHAVLLAVSHSLDNLHALRRLTVTGEGSDLNVSTRPYATFTLMRAGLENACQAAWLLQPDDPTERARRRLRLLMGSEQGRLDALAAMGQPDAAPKTLDAGFTARMLSLGIDESLLKPRRLAASRMVKDAGAVMAQDPRCTSINTATTVEAAWRGMSGIAHGDLWASMSLPSKEVVARDIGGEDVHQLLMHITAAKLWLWVSFTMQPLEHALRLLEAQRLRWVTTQA